MRLALTQGDKESEEGEYLALLEIAGRSIQVLNSGDLCHVRVVGEWVQKMFVSRRRVVRWKKVS
jgi:hypothetical protein